MRLVLLASCLLLSFASSAQAGGAKADVQITYNHIPASVEALACTDPQQQADCKIYFAGFAHTLDLIFATDPKGNPGDGLCGDISDLVYEFAHEVRTNPKARNAETHTVLATVLIRDHNCARLKGQSRIQNNVSAGELIDICHAGDTGFDSCSQYQAGFLSALLFVSEMTGNPMLCGDQSLVSPLSVARILNNGLQADFRLRRDPAVAVMLNELKADMPCPNPISSNSLPKETAVPDTPSANVPFVGCKSDGQVGPQDAPIDKSKTITISPQLAQGLAYYETSDGLDILAPRGWNCFETSGSDGSNLYVTPMRLSSADLFSDKWKGISGPGIQLSTSIGDTSGRFEVAQIIARVFPAHKSFVRRVIAEGDEPATSFPYGPYPADKLTYKSNETVEYVTPPNTEGLGTRSFLIKNRDPIDGVALLTGEELSLTQLSARLPPDMSYLLPVIIRQVERDAATSKTKELP